MARNGSNGGMGQISDIQLRFDDARYASTIGEYDKAFALFSELAAIGHAEAIRWLADSYLRGKGTRQDIEMGLELLERAASLGDSTAAFNLGALHRSGADRVPKDPERSKRFFLLAKELGCELSIESYL